MEPTAGARIWDESVGRLLFPHEFEEPLNAFHEQEPIRVPASQLERDVLIRIYICSGRAEELHAAVSVLKSGLDGS